MAKRFQRRDVLKGIACSAMVNGTMMASGLPHQAAREAAVRWEPVAPGVWRATLGSPESHTPVTSRRFTPALEGLKALPPVSGLPLVEPEFSVTGRGVELSLPLQPDELMYGFGLQMLSFQQRSKKRIIRVNADPKVDSGDSHAPVPFYVTTRGYGVLVDTFRHATFYCGDAHPRPEQPMMSSEVAIGSPQMMRARDRTKEGRVLIEVPRCAGVNVYLFAGPDLRSAVQRYNLFSGGGALPPDWGLGFWYRPEMHLSADEVLALAKEFRGNQIPCDVLGLEPGWQTHAYSCTFVWDKGRFPNPAGFVGQARGLGFHVNLWEHAFTYPASPIFKPLVPYSGNFAVWDGLVPDFAGPEARKIFGDYHGRELIDMGVSGFKLDECDNSDFTEGWSFPDNSKFPSGVDGEQMHAQFGLRYQDAILEQYQHRKQATYSLVRSSGALAGPYPFVLYSDLYDHRVFIRALLNAGFSGLLWCPEVRDAQSDEDLVRRLQSVVFSPLAMVNAWYIRNPPWKQIERAANNADKFTPGWEQLQARCREIIGWRMQMLPYVRAAFAKYKRTGLPPFRALIMDWPNERRLADVDDQYMMGDRLMIAPLFAGESERRIVMPPGQWHDFWTGAPVVGEDVQVPASTDKIPVFAKSGSLVPWAAVRPHAEPEGVRELAVRVYGDGSLGWSSGDEPAAGLRLRWNASQKNGDASGGARNWKVTGWQQIG